MAFVLDPSASVRREVRRVATERLDEAIGILESLEGADPDEIEHAVHDVRKRCKETRAVARLVRSSIGKEFGRFDRAVRAAANTLAPIRDAHAVLATFDHLQAGRDLADDPDLARVRSGHAAIADEATRTVHGGDPRIARARALLVSARGRVGRWDIDDGFAPLAAGIRETYASGRAALRLAAVEPTDEHLHEWRKSVKTLWYQIRLVEPAAPSVLGPLVARLDDLAEALGDDHDLAVLIERLAADPKRFGGKHNVTRAKHLARLQQDDLRRRAFRLGRTIFAESPKAFIRRMEAYWDRTRRDGTELPTGGIAELAADEGHPIVVRGPATTVERERKFLVTEVPELPESGTTMRQGYLAIDGSVSVRVRDAGPDECTLTLKAGRGAVRTELEFPITREQFSVAWEQTGGRRIRKTRHRLPIDGHVVEVDVFHDDLSGLVIAEVEFDSDMSMEAFEPPAWFGPDVTDDVAFTNASLAVNAPRGFPTTPPTS